jgi:hypothetical protein
VEPFRDLLVRHVLEERQSDRLPLVARQRVQRRIDNLPVFVLKGVLFRTWCLIQHLEEHLVVFVKSGLLCRSAVAATEFVEDPPVCQTQEPGSEKTLLRVERSRAAPDGEEDLLDELLGGRAFEVL